MAWTLTYGGTEKSLADWGLSHDIRTERGNMAADTVSLFAPGPMDVAAAFTYGAAVIIRRDRTGAGTSYSGGSIYFSGKATQPRRTGSGSEELISYRFAGPWWDLERLVFQQTWKTYTGDPDDLFDNYASELFLGQDPDGDPLHTGAQITEALNWAIARGVVLQIGTIDPAVNIPIASVRDITVAEVIRMMLRWTPDVLTWFDYSTSPPTFHARSLANLTAVTITPPASLVSTIDLVPKHELVLPSVLIRWKQTDVVDGKSWVRITDQKWPALATGLELGAAVHTIELNGIEGSNVYGDLVCEPILAQTIADNANVGWWQKKLPWLASAKITDLTITSALVKDDGGATVSLATYPNELIDGSLADWMTLEDATPIVGKSVTIKALAEFDLFWDDEHKVDRHYRQSKELSVKVKATNAITGSYATLESFTPAEPIPTGLSQAVYEAHSTLQYEGSLTLVGNEVPTGLGMGCKVNLVLSAATYSNLLVQTVTEDLGNGRMTLTLGPASHLGLSDLIELLRNNRNRWRVVNSQARSTARVNAQTSVTLGKENVRENSSDGVDQAEATAVSAVESEGKRAVVKMDASAEVIKMSVLTAATGAEPSGKAKLLVDLVHDAFGKTLRLREWEVCVGDPPVTKYALFLSSEAYDEPFTEPPAVSKLDFADYFAVGYAGPNGVITHPQSEPFDPTGGTAYQTALTPVDSATQGVWTFATEEYEEAPGRRAQFQRSPGITEEGFASGFTLTLLGTENNPGGGLVSLTIPSPETGDFEDHIGFGKAGPGNGYWFTWDLDAAEGTTAWWVDALGRHDFDTANFTSGTEFFDDSRGEVDATYGFYIQGRTLDILTIAGADV